ncbi:MAG: DoxX family membrane protein [Syntrophaceae bacterium]|nr:DoxX family membrane protein [Syntrophaceae bacterium]
MNASQLSDRLKRILASPLPYHLLRVAMAALFLYAGGVKLLDPKAFAVTISAYNLIPEPLLPVVAIGLPLVEVIAGIGLLFQVRGSLTGIAALMVLFIAVLGYGILSDLDVDCGCFGAEELARRSSLQDAFIRDLVITGIVIPYLYWYQRFRTRAGLNRIQEETKGE